MADYLPFVFQRYQPCLIHPDRSQREVRTREIDPTYNGPETMCLKCWSEYLLAVGEARGEARR